MLSTARGVSSSCPSSPNKNRRPYFKSRHRKRSWRTSRRSVSEERLHQDIGESHADNNSPDFELSSILMNIGAGQNQECFCGKKGVWYREMLQCGKCQNWFHGNCLTSLDHKVFWGDRFYVMICKGCNVGNDVCVRLFMTWPEFVRLMLFNLMLLHRKEYYSLDQNIMPYIDRHWSELKLLPEVANLTEEDRRVHVKKALVDFHMLFHWEKRNLWALRVKGPPKPPLISLPHRGAIDKGFLRIHVKNQLLLPLKNRYINASKKLWVTNSRAVSSSRSTNPDGNNSTDTDDASAVAIEVVYDEELYPKPQPKKIVSVKDGVHFFEDGHYWMEVNGLPDSDDDDDTPSAHIKIASRVGFTREPIRVYSTYSTSEYDRRNEDIDSVVASAQYELEKLVDKMNVFSVDLIKGPEGLGLTTFQLDFGTHEGVEILGVFVKAITKDGAAFVNGRIQVNDQIITVDGKSLVGVTLEFVSSVLNNLSELVHLTIGREWDPENSKVAKIKLQSLQRQNGEQKQECYCGKNGTWYRGMLQCHRCKNWFHASCLTSLENKVHWGDRYYVMICKGCNVGNEVCVRLAMAWPELVRLVLFNLKLIHQKKHFGLDLNIMPYINRHWADLKVLPEMEHMTARNRRVHVKKSLVDYHMLFHWERRNVWGLLVNRPPELPPISLPRLGVSNEDLLRILLKSQRHMPLKNRFINSSKRARLPTTPAIASPHSTSRDGNNSNFEVDSPTNAYVGGGLIKPSFPFRLPDRSRKANARFRNQAVRKAGMILRKRKAGQLICESAEDGLSDTPEIIYESQAVIERAMKRLCQPRRNE